MDEFDLLDDRNIELEVRDPDAVILYATKRAWAAACTSVRTKLSQWQKDDILTESFIDMMTYVDKAEDPNKRLLAAIMMAALADEDNIIRQLGQIKLIQHIETATDPFLRTTAMQVGATSVPLGDELEVKFVDLWKREIRAEPDAKKQHARVQSVMTQKIDDRRLIKKAAMEMELELTNHPLRVFRMPIKTIGGVQYFPVNLGLC